MLERYPTASSTKFLTDGNGAILRTVADKLNDGWVSVCDFGAKGDGTTDDTEAIQAALDTGRHVFLPGFRDGTASRVYKITAPLVQDKIGQIIEGDGANRVIIRQATSGENAFNVRQGTDVILPSYPAGGPIQFPTIARMKIEAANAGTGIGISCGESGLWEGDFVTLEDLFVYNFNVGIQCNGVGQSRMSRLNINTCNIGIEFTGNGQNSHNLRSVVVSKCGIGVSIIGAGGVYELGDVVTNGVHVEITGQAVITGGNYEGFSGDTAIDVKDGSLCVLNGLRFLVGGGNKSPIRCGNTTSVVVICCVMAGFDSGTTLVNATATTSTVKIITPAGAGAYGAGNPGNWQIRRSDLGEVLRGSVFDQRADNALPPAQAENRGAIVQVIGRNATAGDDLIFIGRDVSGSFFTTSLLNRTQLATANTWTAAQTFNGNFLADKTITPGGTTGNRTINKNAGSVNFAMGTQSITVTNSRVTANSVIVATVATDDANATSVKAIPGSGSFVLKLDATAAAETRVNWWVVN